MSAVLTCDPGTHRCGFAVVEGAIAPERFKVVHVWVITVPKSLKEIAAARAMALAVANQPPLLLESRPETLVVESQDQWGKHARGEKRATPRDLINLSLVAGAVAATYSTTPRTLSDYLTPMPQEWKGQQAKRGHQMLIYKALGWCYETRADYVVPTAEIRGQFPHLAPADWKEVNDAIGMGIWAIRSRDKTDRINAALAKKAAGWQP